MDKNQHILSEFLEKSLKINGEIGSPNMIFNENLYEKKFVRICEF